jgi:energy-coupling factor transporter ATP-binding protein EcfA2
VKISIPELSLVLLVGPSGCGKSSFARKHFLPTEVVSSDFCRALVSDNENDQSATEDAFDLLHEIIRKRLTRGRLRLHVGAVTDPLKPRFDPTMRVSERPVPAPELSRAMRASSVHHRSQRPIEQRVPATARLHRAQHRAKPLVKTTVS